MNEIEIAAGLRRLRTPAPDSILPAVLIGTGLADGYVRRTSPIGEVFVAFNAEGISVVRPGEDASAFERWCSKRLRRRAIRVEAMPARLEGLLDRALATGRPGRLSFDLRTCSDFAAAVLDKTTEIPPGEVRPYSWVAREIGRPGAVRAVGTALAANPIPILIPCHRVVRADGSIGNYAFGAEAKRVLLSAEGLDPGEAEKLAGRGIRFVGSATTSVYCYPSCRDARRITGRHRIEFTSPDEAADAGFRPCLHCRPRAA